MSDGTKTAVCENGCGATDTVTDVGTAKGHSFDEWVITEKATETEKGTKERVCSACRFKETKRIPVLTPSEYSFSFGENSEWTKGNNDGLDFFSDAPFDSFNSLKIDGTAIETANYTVEPDRSRISISAAFLEKLGPGYHSVEIVSADGKAFAYFTIVGSQSTNPASFFCS